MSAYTRGVEALKQREDLHQAGGPVGRGGVPPTACSKRPRAAAGAILHVELEAATGTDAGHGRRRKHEDEGLAQLLHRPRRSFKMPSVVRCSLRRSSNGFNGTNSTPELGALVKVAPSKPANVTVCATPGRDSRISEALRTTASVRSRLAPGGKRDHRDEIGAIQRRNETRRRARELEISQADQAGIDRQHESRYAQHPPRRLSVAVRQLAEPSVEAGEEGVEWTAPPSSRSPASPRGHADAGTTPPMPATASATPDRK